MIGFSRIFVFVVLLAGFAAPSQAAYRITEQDKADIARIETYLNAMESLRSKFVQLSTGGKVAEGTIYIERPKRLRLQYKNPSNIQVYANGNWLAHVDTDLEAVWHVPLKATPAAFLVRDQIKLSGDITVERVIRDARTISVSLVQTAEPDSGRFVLTFSDSPLALRKWTVTDVQGVSTSVSLVAPAFNVAIPREIFIFDESKFEPEVQ
ncbi:MAG: outer membrane lipoprotein-sorting protein [Paracoccaceae bacterium]|jgi:outer membrane lipoprotein-sorting protein